MRAKGTARNSVGPELRCGRRARVADGRHASLRLMQRWRPHSRMRSMLGTFRPYHSTDVRGVELGGATKNVLAIAAGIVTGRGLGASASAALTTRGFAELVRFGKALRRQDRNHDGSFRPRRSHSYMLDPAVAQLLLWRRVGEGREGATPPRMTSSPKVYSPPRR